MIANLFFLFIVVVVVSVAVSFYQFLCLNRLTKQTIVFQPNAAERPRKIVNYEWTESWACVSHLEWFAHFSVRIVEFNASDCSVIAYYGWRRPSFRRRQRRRRRSAITNCIVNWLTFVNCIASTFDDIIENIISRQLRPIIKNRFIYLYFTGRRQTKVCVVWRCKQWHFSCI